MFCYCAFCWLHFLTWWPFLFESRQMATWNLIQSEPSFWYSFIHLGGERLCIQVSCPRKQHDDSAVPPMPRRDQTWVTTWLASFADFLKKWSPFSVMWKGSSIKWRSMRNVETSSFPLVGKGRHFERTQGVSYECTNLKNLVTWSKQKSTTFQAQATKDIGSARTYDSPMNEERSTAPSWSESRELQLLNQSPFQGSSGPQLGSLWGNFTQKTLKKSSGLTVKW